MATQNDLDGLVNALYESWPDVSVLLSILDYAIENSMDDAFVRGLRYCIRWHKIPERVVDTQQWYFIYFSGSTKKSLEARLDINKLTKHWLPSDHFKKRVGFGNIHVQERDDFFECILRIGTKVLDEAL